MQTLVDPGEQAGFSGPLRLYYSHRQRLRRTTSGTDFHVARCQRKRWFLPETVPQCEIQITSTFVEYLDSKVICEVSCTSIKFLDDGNSGGGIVEITLVFRKWNSRYPRSARISATLWKSRTNEWKYTPCVQLLRTYEYRIQVYILPRDNRTIIVAVLRNCNYAFRCFIARTPRIRDVSRHALLLAGRRCKTHGVEPPRRRPAGWRSRSPVNSLTCIDDDSAISTLLSPGTPEPHFNQKRKGVIENIYRISEVII